MSDKLFIFPTIRKWSDMNFTDVDPSDISSEEIDKLAYHYLGQVREQLKYHGIGMSETFERDFDTVQETLKSTLRRSIGRYHPLQDYVDDLADLKKLYTEADQELRETKEEIEELNGNSS